jgi:hypothetical protein
VKSTPEGFQIAFVEFGGQPGPSPSPQSVAQMSGYPGGEPDSVPHHLTGLFEIPTPPNATAVGCAELSSAFKRVSISDVYPPSNCIKRLREKTLKEKMHWLVYRLRKKTNLNVLTQISVRSP